MNIRTACFIALDDVVALKVSFSNSTSVYTYFAKSSWLPNDIAVNQAIIVPGPQDYKMPKIAYFKGFAMLEDLDLDSAIEYKWIFGVVPETLLIRYEESEQQVNTLMQSANRNRIDSIRQQARQYLGLSFMPTNEKGEQQ